MTREQITEPVGEPAPLDLLDQTVPPRSPRGNAKRESLTISMATRASGATLRDIPFVQRPTCTVREACRASGLGRTKLYELMRRGVLKSSLVDRRRLVFVPSLLRTLKFRDAPNEE